MGTKFKELRRSYGFDEVAIVSGDFTINPDHVDIGITLGGVRLDIPILASAMDGVVDTRFAITMGKLGGLAVLNLDGVQTRYENPGEVLAEIAAAPADQVTALLQKAYAAATQENLIGERVKAVKDAGLVCAVSAVPQNAKRFAPLAAEAGADIFVVQSTVTTARHISKSHHGLRFNELCQAVRVPIIVGNCVTYSATRELMETGISGLLVGVGPGAACTTREVLGIGVPQVTATIDSAAARNDHFKATGKYVSIITDGGIRTGGDLCKAFASGADAVMMGSPFALTEEAPGRGNHWCLSCGRRESLHSGLWVIGVLRHNCAKPTP